MHEQNGSKPGQRLSFTLGFLWLQFTNPQVETNKPLQSTLEQRRSLQAFPQTTQIERFPIVVWEACCIAWKSLFGLFEPT